MEPTPINTQLRAKASEALQKEIDTELELPDPEDERVIAKLLELEAEDAV